MASNTKQVARELPYMVKVYTDGSIERRYVGQYAPPSSEPDPKTGISTKDVTICQNVSARIYLPKLSEPDTKFPILVYYHGGAFCVGSAFTALEHNYVNVLVAKAQAIVVSVEYRIVPEYDLPAAFDDSWDALKWVVSHAPVNRSSDQIVKDPWILNHADFDRLFLGGDSAGGNIVHNIAMKAGSEGLDGSINILGAFMGCPYFWGSKPLPEEPNENHENTFPYLVWDFSYPSSPNGLDNFMINPVGPGAPSLKNLGCRKLFVLVAEKDELRHRGVWYYELIKESEWDGEVEFFEAKGQSHCFYVGKPEKETAKIWINLVASFLNK